MITAGDIAGMLEDLAPNALQEPYDNSGLITGSPDQEISGALVCLDVTPEVIAEAAGLGLNMVISHHPPVFEGLKRFSGRTVAERVVTDAIRKDVVLYACHTNLDQVAGGVSDRMADRLDLRERQVLSPRAGDLVKLVCFVPKDFIQNVSQAVFKAGAGRIGKYDSCSFQAPGTGTFRGDEGTSPFVGIPGEFHWEEEIRFETILPARLSSAVIEALLAAHPYEEVAYDLYPLLNANSGEGFGRIGILPRDLSPEEFLGQLKDFFGTPVIRHSAYTGERIRKVAVCGGSGSGFITRASFCLCDAYVTADIKYHQWFDVPPSMLVADIGHYESEQFAINCLHDFLVEKFPNFAVRLTRIITNPVKYF